MHSIVFYYCTPDVLATITGIKPFAEEILGPPKARGCCQCCRWDSSFSGVIRNLSAIWICFYWP